MAGLSNFVLGTMVILTFITLILGFTGSYLGIMNPDSEVLNDQRFGLSSAMKSSSERLDMIGDQIDRTSQDLIGATVDPISYMFLISKALFEIPKTVFIFLLGGILSIPVFLFKGLGGTGAGKIVTLGVSLIIAGLVIQLVLIIIKVIRIGETER